MTQQLPVSDHAVIRYLERVLMFDIEGVRKHIWQTCEPAIKVGAICLRAEGAKFEFSNGRVVTVVPDGPEPNRTSRENSQHRARRS